MLHATGCWKLSVVLPDKDRLVDRRRWRSGFATKGVIEPRRGWHVARFIVGAVRLLQIGMLAAAVGSRSWMILWLFGATAPVPVCGFEHGGSPKLRQGACRLIGLRSFDALAEALAPACVGEG